MIINRPTGIYRSILPSTPDDNESVVYTISSDIEIPRPLDFIQLPQGFISNPKEEQHTFMTRRGVLGDLVYTVKKGGMTSVLSGERIYNLGDILEFTDDNVSDDVLIINDNVDVQHNISRLNYEITGLDESEITNISSQLQTAQQLLLQQIEQLQTERRQLEISTKNLSIKISECNKAINGIESLIRNNGILDDSALSASANKLKVTRDNAQSQLDLEIARLNQIPDEINAKKNDLNTMSKFIK